MNARRVRPLLVVALAFAVPASAEAAQKRHLRLGSLTFHRCLPTRRGWCGSVSRPLDPARSHGARIRIGFQWLPPRHRRSGPALVAVEGGPGYPSAGSVLEYHGIFSRLIGRRGLLLVDNRGTGMSALIDFAPLQSFTGRTSGPRFAARVAGCPRQTERRYPHVHVDLFAAELVHRLRTAPLTGITRNSDGSRARARVTGRTIVDLVQDAASGPVIYRELDPSVPAALAGDPCRCCAWRCSPAATTTERARPATSRTASTSP
jgi:hypothetical protein